MKFPFCSKDPQSRRADVIPRRSSLGLHAVQPSPGGETHWSEAEVDRFWAVFCSYLSHLLAGELHLPWPSLEVVAPPDCVRSLDESIWLGVRCPLWQGRYSLAVANWRLILRHFGAETLCKSCAFHVQPSDEIQTLRNIFKRRVPPAVRP